MESQTILARVAVEIEHRGDFKSLSKPLLFEELARHFDVSADEAAEKLGVCMSAIKKICRRHGIIRWPHRKLHSATKAIRVIETKLSEMSDPVAIESLKRETINILVTKLRVVLNPNYIISAELVQMSNSRGGDALRIGAGLLQDDESSEDETGVVQAQVIGAGFPGLPGMMQPMNGGNFIGLINSGGVDAMPNVDSVAKLVLDQTTSVPVRKLADMQPRKHTRKHTKKRRMRYCVCV